MKKTYLTIACVAALALTACGGGNASKNAEAQEPEASEQTAEAAPAEPAASQGTPSLEDFSAQLKEACGVEPIITDKMTAIKVRKSVNEGLTEYSMNSPVSDESDKEEVQRNYFNAFAKVADGNNIYGFHMDQSRGNDAFKNYDEYVKYIQSNGDYDKATYGFDYKGKKVRVYCSVAFGDFGLSVKVE